MSKVSSTIRLSDTIDQYARRVHVNVRNDKVTMVYRWKDTNSTKSHTQRMTLTDEQVARLNGALTKAAARVLATRPECTDSFVETLVSTVTE